MQIPNAIDFIYIGNVGIEENYIYILCSLIGITVIYVCLKPFIRWAMKFKLRRLLSYLVCSLVTFLFVFCLASFTANPDKVIRIAFQSIALFGMIMSLFIWAGYFVKRVN